jgi:hypothetical protein
MAGDSSSPQLSQRVPGATNRPTPQNLIAPPVLPRSLLERLRAELRAELSEAQAGEQPGRQLPLERPGQPASVPLPVPETDDGRPGRAKRRLLRDSRSRRPSEYDVTSPVPVVTAFATAEEPTPAAETVNGLAALAATDLAQQTAARPPPQRRTQPDPERAPATADLPRMPTPPEMAKAAAALLAPYPEDITQPIPVIGAAAQDDAVRPATKTVNGRSDFGVTAPERQAAARPLPKRARPRHQKPPAADVPRLPTPTTMPTPTQMPTPTEVLTPTPTQMPAPTAAAALLAPYPHDITQPIPAVRTEAETQVLSPAAETVDARPDLAPAEAAPPDQVAETPADRKRRAAERAARQRRQRLEGRRGRVIAAPQLDADQLLRPVFPDAGRFDEGTVEEVVASVRAQRDWRKAQAGWRRFR